ncbi:conserved hypothetical protein [Ricinus communis]|uniref:Uncharacterized protein n=1 Tax=Ricinus communis TaxID=3988 RepID=B9RVQ3_RICCO|nr:conserved hypothetical protein [Ricinus communis]
MMKDKQKKVKMMETKEEFVEKVSIVLKKMAEAVVEFGEIMAEIGRGEEEFDTDIGKHDENDDYFFNDPSFLNAVAELEQAISKTQKYPVAKVTHAHSFSLGFTPEEKDENGQQEKE